MIYDLNGDVFYGVEVIVLLEYCGLCLGCCLYEVCKELCCNFNLKFIMVGGWIFNYVKYVLEMLFYEYIEWVKLKDIFDFIFIFQLFNGFEVK